jgi:Tol biopolymer transport system component
VKIRVKRCRYLRIIVAVALVAVLVCGCAGDRGTDGDAVDHGGSLVSEAGQIAFTRATKFTPPDFESEIYTINVDGSNERRLTDSPGLDAFPAWSPDGEHIAFASDRDGNWELYVTNSAGTEMRRLTNTAEDESSPAWSPVGEKMAYVTDVIDGNETIRVMNADGSGRRRLADGNWPSWSPDGERIVYTVYSASEVGHLFVMNADGSGQRSLGASVLQRLLGIRGAEEPAWSPKGEKIAFASMDNGEIYAMNSDGSGRTRLTDIPGADHWPPTWSPDGRRIAFTSEGTKGNPEIYVMNSDGSGLTKLTDDPADDSFPAWRP